MRVPVQKTSQSPPWALDKACSLAAIRTLEFASGDRQARTSGAQGAIAMKIVGGKSERKYQRYYTVDQRISLRGLAVGDV